MHNFRYFRTESGLKFTLTTKLKHVLVCGPLHPDGMTILENCESITYELIEDKSEVLESHIADADGISLRICKMTPAMLDKAPNLQVISRHGVGCDNVPVDECTKRGIPVMVTGSANSYAVAEHAIFFMFALARQGLKLDKAVRSGNWQARATLPTFELAGRNLLVVGCGRIGRLLVSMAQGLKMNVTVFDPYLTEDDCKKLGVNYAADLEKTLPDSDVVSLHLPSTGEPLMGEKQLAMMKSTAILINVARGDLIDEQALAKALEQGKLAGAGLDVFGVEPPVDNPLLKLDSVILTAHTAALTDDSKRRMGMVCAQNVLDFLDKKADPSMYFNPDWLNNQK